MLIKLLIFSTLLTTIAGALALDEAFRKRYAYRIEGVTLDGGPVLTIPYGEWDVVRAIRDGEKEKLRAIYHEIFDKLANISIQPDGKVKSGVSIFDMTKYSVLQGFSPEVYFVNDVNVNDWIAVQWMENPSNANAFMIEMTEYFETKYDNRILKRWYLINTPTPFTMAYNLLKLFLPEQARVKWKVYGPVRYYWQLALFQDVSPEQLPQQYGGIKDIPAAATELTDTPSSTEPEADTEDRDPDEE